MLRKLIVVLMAILALTSVAQAALPAIDPAVIGQVTAACGGGILPVALKYGEACLKGAQKTKKVCPTACKTLLAAAPNQACIVKVASLAPGPLATKMKKVRVDLTVCHAVTDALEHAPKLTLSPHPADLQEHHRQCPQVSGASRAPACKVPPAAWL